MKFKVLVGTRDIKVMQTLLSFFDAAGFHTIFVQNNLQLLYKVLEQKFNLIVIDGDFAGKDIDAMVSVIQDLTTDLPVTLLLPKWDNFSCVEKECVFRIDKPLSTRSLDRIVTLIMRLD